MLAIAAFATALFAAAACTKLRRAESLEAGATADGGAPRDEGRSGGTAVAGTNGGASGAGRGSAAGGSSATPGTSNAGSGASAPGGSGADGGAAPARCESGMQRCGDRCVLADDPTACGPQCQQCPIDPQGSAMCRNGACELECRAGFHRCNGACVSDHGVDHCGPERCDPCLAPRSGTASCDGVACQPQCPNDTKLCAGACIAESEACDGTCPAGTRNCAELCVDLQSTSACGPSCGLCPIPLRGRATCDGTQCGFACDPDSHACGDECVPDGAAGAEEVHAVYGCGHRFEAASGDWVVFTSGLHVDEKTGYGWYRLTGPRDHAAATTECNALQVGNLGGFALPTIDQVRTLADGCAKTAPGGSCGITHDGCLNYACVTGPECESCQGGLGPHAGEYCRAPVQICDRTHTRSLCPDCPNGTIWDYGPANGDFGTHPTDHVITALCVRTTVPTY